MRQETDRCLRPKPLTAGRRLVSTVRPTLVALAMALGAGAALGQAGPVLDDNFLANKKFVNAEGTVIEEMASNSSAYLDIELFNTFAQDLSEVTVVDSLPVTNPVGQFWFPPTAAADLTLIPTGCATSVVPTYQDEIEAGSKFRTLSLKLEGVPFNLSGPACTVRIPVQAGRFAADVNINNEVPQGGALAKLANSEDTYAAPPFTASVKVKAHVNPLQVGKSFRNPNNANQTITFARGGSKASLQVAITNNTSEQQTGVSLTDSLPAGITADGAPAFNAACGTPTPTSTTTADAPNNTVLNMAGGTIAAGASCVVTVPVAVSDAVGSIPAVNTINPGGVKTASGAQNENTATATLNIENTFRINKFFEGNNGWRSNDAVENSSNPLPANNYGIGNIGSDEAAVEVGQAFQMRLYFSNPYGTTVTGSFSDLLPNSLQLVPGANVTGCGLAGHAVPATETVGDRTKVTVNGISIPAATGTSPAQCEVTLWVTAKNTVNTDNNVINPEEVNLVRSDSGGAVGLPASGTSAKYKATHTGQGGSEGPGSVKVSKQFSRNAPANSSTWETSDYHTGTNGQLLVEPEEQFWLRLSVFNDRYDYNYENGKLEDLLPAGLRVVRGAGNEPVYQLRQNPPGGSGRHGHGTAIQPGAPLTAACSAAGTLTVANVNGRENIVWQGFAVQPSAGSSDYAVRQGCVASIKVVTDTTLARSVNNIPANSVEITRQGTTLKARNPAGVTAVVAAEDDLSVRKTFNPNTVGYGVGAKSRVTIEVASRNAAALPNLQLEDLLPAGLTVANPDGFSSTCSGGSIDTSTEGNRTKVSYSGGTVPGGGNGSCEIGFDVETTAAVTGNATLTNTIEAAAVKAGSGSFNALPTSADLLRRNLGVSVVKSFNPSNATGGKEVDLTLRFSATSASTGPQDLIELVDDFAEIAGEPVLVANDPNATTTCMKKDGTTPADIVAQPGGKSVGISGFYFGPYSAPGDAEPANTCELKVRVVLTKTGTHVNRIKKGDVKTSAGSTNPSDTTASVTALANTQLIKSFDSDEVEVGEPVRLTFTVHNVRTTAISNFSVTDTLPDGMLVDVAPQFASTCGSAVLASAGSGVAKITGLSVGANESCTNSLNVRLTKAGEFTNASANIEVDNPSVHHEIEEKVKAVASSIAGTVFIDPERNAATAGYEAGETGIPGVPISLFRDGVFYTATETGADGTYRFDNLPSGNYHIEQVQPDGYTSTGNRPGNASTPGTAEPLYGPREQITGIVLGRNEHAVGYDFGEIVAQPSIDLTKTAGSPSGNAVDATIAYSFVVKNTGNVPLSNIVLTDPKLGGAVSCAATSLEPQAETSCGPVNYKITQADLTAGKVDNTATVQGTPPAGGDPVTDEDKTSTPLQQGPAIRLTKTAGSPSGNAVDATIAYSFVVKNTGNVPLSNIVLTDPKLGGAVSCAATSLAPQAETSCGPVNYKITQADLDAGKVDNTATVKGKSPLNVEVSDEDDTSTPLQQSPAIQIVKSVTSEGPYRSGDTIEYQFVVTNTGNVVLNGVQISDELEGLSAISYDWPGVQGLLNAGQSVTATASYEVKPADAQAGKVYNKATTTGNPPTGDPVTDDDDVTTPVIVPQVTPVPVDSPWALALAALLLMLLAGRGMRFGRK